MHMYMPITHGADSNDSACVVVGVICMPSHAYMSFGFSDSRITSQTTKKSLIWSSTIYSGDSRILHAVMTIIYPEV